MDKNRKLVFKKLTVRNLTDSQAAAAVGANESVPPCCPTETCQEASWCATCQTDCGQWTCNYCSGGTSHCDSQGEECNTWD